MLCLSIFLKLSKTIRLQIHYKRMSSKSQTIQTCHFPLPVEALEILEKLSDFIYRCKRLCFSSNQTAGIQFNKYISVFNGTAKSGRVSLYTGKMWWRCCCFSQREIITPPAGCSLSLYVSPFPTNTHQMHFQTGPQ